MVSIYSTLHSYKDNIRQLPRGGKGRVSPRDPASDKTKNNVSGKTNQTYSNTSNKGNNSSAKDSPRTSNVADTKGSNKTVSGVNVSFKEEKSGRRSDSKE